MKQVVLLILSFFIFTAYSNANTAGIAAIVEDKTITFSQLEKYKKLMSFFGNIKPSSVGDQEYTKIMLGSMIDDEVLVQYANKIGINASDEEINNFTNNIESNAKLPAGQLTKIVVNELHLSATELKNKIRIEVLRSKVIREILSQNINITKSDVESIALNFRDADVDLKIFTGKDNTDKTYKSLRKLKNKIQNCKQLRSLKYKYFSTLSEVNTKLSELSPDIQALVKDMSVGQASEVMKGSDMKVIVLCEKKINQFSPEESNSVAQFLGNKKLSLKAKKFFQNLRKKAYVKVLL